MVEVVVWLIEVDFPGGQLLIKFPLLSTNGCHFTWERQFTFRNSPVLPVHGIGGSLVVRVLLRATGISSVGSVGLQHRDVGVTVCKKQIQRVLLMV